ncbi:hypothetical protein CR513_04706, partial [Mucuna pruriens]
MGEVMECSYSSASTGSFDNLSSFRYTVKGLIHVLHSSTQLTSGSSTVDRLMLSWMTDLCIPLFWEVASFDNKSSLSFCSLGTWWSMNFSNVAAILVARSSLISASSASYSAWLLLALNSKWSDCLINTPFGPSNITPTLLPVWLEALSTDKNHPLFTFASSLSAVISVTNTYASDPTNSSDSNSDLGSSGASYDSNFGVGISQFGLDNMENNDKTLKELATLDVMYQPWCIQYTELEQAQSYEPKSGFHSLVGEDPHKHLMEFHFVCSTMRPPGIHEDYIKMKSFVFSLDGATND